MFGCGSIRIYHRNQMYRSQSHTTEDCRCCLLRSHTVNVLSTHIYRHTCGSAQIEVDVGTQIVTVKLYVRVENCTFVLIIDAILCIISTRNKETYLITTTTEINGISLIMRIITEHRHPVSIRIQIRIYTIAIHFQHLIRNWRYKT